MADKRPAELQGTTPRVKTKCGYMYVTLNESGGKLIEMFIKIGKSGTCARHYTEMAGRVITTAVKRGASLEKIIHAIDRCAPCQGAALSTDGVSCGEAIVKILSDYAESKKEPITDDTDTNQETK